MRAIYTIFLCTLIASLFGLVSYQAVLTKSATYDEPVHFGAAYAHVFLHDDRTDAENPVLWKYWAMLPISRNELQIDPADPSWRSAGDALPTRHWSTAALYEGHAEKGNALIQRARGAMVLLGMMLILLSAGWAYQLAGPVAAVAAAAMLAIDPTLLAHAPLIKNDVPMALAMLLAIALLWRAGERFSFFRLVVCAIASAVAINIKFSAALVPVMVMICFTLRLFISQPWPDRKQVERPRLRRLVSVPLMAALILLAAWAVTWWAYGFRFRAGNESGLGFTSAEPFSGGVDFLAGFAQQQHLLPEAFCVGFIRQHNAIQLSQNFLLGNIGTQGWWYYFPFAWGVKTPIGLLLLAATIIIVGFKTRRRWWTSHLTWPAVCLLLPAGVYLLSAMASNYNHGIRNLLPIYPLVYISVACLLAKALEVHVRWIKPFSVICLLAAMLETGLAYPNFIAFCNFAAGGSAGGLALLGDSNLDWGQDLPQLVKWHQAHPQTKLYAAYFGAADPMWFDLPFTPLPGYYTGVPDAPPDPQSPGVIAISATLLQGLYVRRPWDAMYAEIRSWKPREVLGGSIYLYDFPPPEMAAYAKPPSPVKK